MGWICRIVVLGAVSLSIVWATPINVALGKPVTPGGGSVYGDLSTAVDGVFCDGCAWNSAGPYWYSLVSYIDIDFGGVFAISSALVQAESNNTYLLQYRDPLGVYHDWWDIPVGALPFGELSTRPNYLDNTEWQPLTGVSATGVRVWATSAVNGNLSVSEIQVLGDTPEPATFALVLMGLAGLGGLARRRRTASRTL